MKNNVFNKKCKEGNIYFIMHMILTYFKFNFRTFFVILSNEYRN